MSIRILRPIGHAAVAALVIVAAGCGDDAEPTGSSAPADTSASVSTDARSTDPPPPTDPPSPTSVPDSTGPVETPPPDTEASATDPPSTDPPPPTAAPATDPPPATGPPPPTDPPVVLDLEPFFATADELDALLRSGADVVEANRDPVNATLDPALMPTIDWPFDTTAGLPPGLTADTEHALLMVVANLQSRWLGLQRGAVGYADPTDFAVEEAFDAFDIMRSAETAYENTVADARLRAESEPATALFDASSPEAGILTARASYLGLILGGCDSYGTDAAGLAAIAEAPIEVVWGQIDNPPWGDDIDYDGVVGGIPFEAEFVGDHWAVLIMAC